MTAIPCRPPQGGRGLKFLPLLRILMLLLSSSARRTWIEIIMFQGVTPEHGSSSARRTWIEIHDPFPYAGMWLLSSSARRTWIEIFNQLVRVYVSSQSSSARRTWIEMFFPRKVSAYIASSSARRTWIEIFW